MTTWQKAISAYWIAGCLLVGLGSGTKVVGCPKDDPLSPASLVAFVSIWPYAIGWAIAVHGHALPDACSKP